MRFGSLQTVEHTPTRNIIRRMGVELERLRALTGSADSPSVTDQSLETGAITACDATGTTQLTLCYSDSAKTTFTVDSTGALAVDSIGSAPKFTFKDQLSVNDGVAETFRFPLTGNDGWINNGANFGFGTVSPSYPFHIFTGTSSATAGAAQDDLVIEALGSSGMQFLGNSANNPIQTIAFGDDGNASIGRLFYDHSLDSMTFVASGNKRFVVHNDGVSATKGGSAPDPPLAVGHFNTAGLIDHMRLSYNGSNYCTFVVNSSGDLTIACTGTNPELTVGDVNMDTLQVGDTASTDACLIKTVLQTQNAIIPSNVHFCNGDGEFNSMQFYSQTKDDTNGGNPTPERYAFVFNQRYDSGTDGPSLGLMAFCKAGVVNAVMSDGGTLYHNGGDPPTDSYIYETASGIDFTGDMDIESSGILGVASGGTFIAKAGSLIDFLDWGGTPATPGSGELRLFRDNANDQTLTTLPTNTPSLFMIDNTGVVRRIATDPDPGTGSSSFRITASDEAGSLFIIGSGVSPSRLGSSIGLYRSFADVAGYIYCNTNNQVVFDSDVQGSETDTGQAWIDLDDGSASFSNIVNFERQSSAPAVPTSGVTIWVDSDVPNKAYINMEGTAGWNWIQLVKAP